MKAIRAVNALNILPRDYTLANLDVRVVNPNSRSEREREQKNRGEKKIRQ